MPTLNWIGKEAVVKHHKDVPYRLIEPVAELSCGDVDSGNLIVQGDNLHALKSLLPRYAGQVKCIYIDPPYNTGNENWVYNDNVNSPEIRKWLGQVVGKEGETLDRHDRWLCMMYPRLVLLHQFLREDGAIFVSIDDNEVISLRALMDEIFGVSNFLGTVIWEKADSPRMDAQFFSGRHDYMIVYARTFMKMNFNRLLMAEGDQPTHYDKTDSEGRLYYLKPLRAMGGQGDSRAARPTLYYPLTAPDGTEIYPVKQDGADGAWRWRKEKVEEEYYRIDWIKGRKGWMPYFRIYADIGGGRPPETIWFHNDVGSNRTSKSELKTLFPELNTFATPKPIRLIQRILQIASDKDSLILDSFAGSGTTGHAVLKQNAEDGGNRRFILVEMDENIAQNVTAERVRRVAQGYVRPSTSSGRTEESVPGLGGGFQFCKLSAEPLFTPDGQVRTDVTFAQLAEFVWFVETGTGRQIPPNPPLPKWGAAEGSRNILSPLIGVHEGSAVYLLYNGILKDRSVAGGNVLSGPVYESLPIYNGPKVIYAAACRLGTARLSRENIVFKQTPYALEV